MTEQGGQKEGPSTEQEPNILGILNKCCTFLTPKEYTFLGTRVGLQKPLHRASGFLPEEEYNLLVQATHMREIYRVNTTPIDGTIQFESGTIESDIGDISLVVQEPLVDESGLMYIEVNTGKTMLVVEDPSVLVKPVFQRSVSVHGTPSEKTKRIIYVESNSPKGVKIHYPNSPMKEGTKSQISNKRPQVEYHPQPELRSI